VEADIFVKRADVGAEVLRDIADVTAEDDDFFVNVTFAA
jgi:hypothetical protein